MRILFLSLLLLSGVMAAERPNVLFITIDDLNDWVGPLKGHPQVKTPNMDRLAALGTTFTNAHCQSVLCNPSRSSLLTGRRATATGIYGLSAACPMFRNAAVDGPLSTRDADAAGGQGE